MKTTKVPVTPCVGCGRLNNVVAHARATPKPGDVTVCIECGAVMVLDDQLHQVGASEDVVREVRRQLDAQIAAKRARLN